MGLHLYSDNEQNLKPSCAIKYMMLGTYRSAEKNPQEME